MSFLSVPKLKMLVLQFILDLMEFRLDGFRKTLQSYGDLPQERIVQTKKWCMQLLKQINPCYDMTMVMVKARWLSEEGLAFFWTAVRYVAVHLCPLFYIRLNCFLVALRLNFDHHISRKSEIYSCIFAAQELAYLRRPIYLIDTSENFAKYVFSV